MQSARKGIKTLLNRLGYDIQRLHPASDPTCQLLASLDRFGVDLVFDVGANAGQFASRLRTMGFGGEIVSFEPLSSAFMALSEAARQDTHWIVHPRCAIGDRDGEISINIAANSVSSSVLPMMDAHLAAAEDSRYIGAESVPVHRLDSVASRYLSTSARPFLKIDTQGFEWQVLDGAEQVLPRMYGVLCELSLVPLYEGQRLWRDVIERLETEGFTLWSLQKGFVDPRDGRTLQLDAVFVRMA
jgi:FkbM family methyltransferase